MYEPITFELSEWTELESNTPKVRRIPLQCSVCGRFAKYGGGRHYYNGHFNCYSYDTICSQCGTVTVECV